MPSASNINYPCTNDFELATLRQVFSDQTVLPKLSGCVNPSRFSNANCKILLEICLKAYSTTKIVPTPVVAVQHFRDKVDAGKETFEKLEELEKFVQELTSIIPVPSDYVLNFFGEQERKAAMWTALESSIRLHKTGDYEKIVNSVTRAAQVGKFEISSGTDFIKSLPERSRLRREGKTPKRLGIGIRELDDALKGGLAPGELGVFVGAPKKGKSILLNEAAIHAASQGLHVVYFTLELSESEIVNRMDAHVSGVKIDDLPTKPDFVEMTVDSWFSRCKGFIKVKEFPGSTTKVSDLDACLEQLRIEENIQPKLLIVDSGDFMKSEERADNTYMEQGSVYKELKGFAKRWNSPIWTAAWAKRDSLEKEIVTMADVGESFRKAGISDVGVAICGKEEEAQTGIAKLYVAWCRFAAGNVAVGPFQTNFAEGRFVKRFVSNGWE